MLAVRAPAVARVGAPKRSVVVQASQAPQQPVVAPVSRRSTGAALAALAALPLLLASPAEARDAKEALKASEARKAKLREAVKSMAETGKSKPAFSTSRYQLPEEATTPNMRSQAKPE